MENIFLTQCVNCVTYLQSFVTFPIKLDAPLTELILYMTKIEIIHQIHGEQPLQNGSERRAEKTRSSLHCGRFGRNRDHGNAYY